MPSTAARSRGGSRARVVQLEGAGSRPLPPASPADDCWPRAPTGTEVRAELRQARAALATFKKHLNTGLPPDRPAGAVLGDGTAIAPDNARRRS